MNKPILPNAQKKKSKIWLNHVVGNNTKLTRLSILGYNGVFQGLCHNVVFPCFRDYGNKTRSKIDL